MTSVAAFLALVLALFVGPVRAQTPTSAICDFERCKSESKLLQQSFMEFQKYSQGLDSVLQRLQQGGVVYLPAAEIKELATLYEKTTPNDAEKKRLTELEGKADGKIGAYKRLEQVATPNDDQKRQLAELSDASAGGSQALQDIAQDYRKRLTERDREMTQKLNTEIRVAVSKVAKEKGVTIVYDASVVLYAGVDITEDVVKAVK
jgi:Skp family chaperone for outer membrane proteins